MAGSPPDRKERSMAPNPAGISPLGTAHRGPVDFADVAVRLHDRDDVAIAKTPLLPRMVLQRDGEDLTIGQMIPPGHKVALHDIPKGREIRRYGQIIGFASADIPAGRHVHTQNVEVHQGELKLDYAFGADADPVRLVPESERRTFMGYRRPDGR